MKNKMRAVMQLLILAATTLTTTLSNAQEIAMRDSVSYRERLEWFGKAKLGIFIHWGIYAVDGVSESWSFYNERLSYTDYMAQAKRFTASRYNPEEWVRLIKDSGAQYTVITSKHHDGIALWDTEAGKLSTRKSTAAHRDVLTPFVEEVRRQGLRLGIYYSLLDWSHKDYPNYTKSITRYKNDNKRWQRFCQFNFAQMRELRDKYNPDLWWFDGDWEQSAEAWHASEIIDMLRADGRKPIVNSRIQGYGDYETPEHGIPINRPTTPYWELCQTMNDSWGYYPTDTNYKTPYQILRTFVDCLSMGGNLLLDIGPREDGTICEEQVAILKAVGRWTRKHAEAIYSTREGIPRQYFQGYTTLNQHGDTLYLYIPYRPHQAFDETTSMVELKGLMSKVERAWVVGSGEEISYKMFNQPSWSQIPGNFYIYIPYRLLDDDITVVGLKLAEPLRLYEGHGKIMDYNE